MAENRKLRAGENFFAWLMLALGVFILVQAYLISGFSSINSPGTFPMGAATVMVVSATLILLQNRKLAKPKVDSLKAEVRQAAAEVLPRVFLLYTVVIIAYMLLIRPLHFLPSSFAFMLLSIIYLKGGRPLKALVISSAMLGFIYIVFQYFFRVVLP